MHELTKAEQFTLVEDAVKTGVAPAEIAAAFNELTALRQELKRLGEPESYYLKAMNCPHHHRIFAAPFLCNAISPDRCVLGRFRSAAVPAAAGEKAAERIELLSGTRW